MPLPPGTALNPATGEITGVPTQAGTFGFTLRVRDTQGNQRDIPQSITIDPYTPPTLSGTMDSFSYRSVAYSDGLTVNDGVGPFVWSISAGTLPAGLTINTSTGVISGTPTDTTYTDRPITIRVEDANGSSAQYSFTLRYADLLTLTGSLVSGVNGAAYSDGFDRAGGHSPFTFAIVSGSLPPGLSFNASTGVISGTPTSTSSTALTIRCTDAAGTAVEASDTLVIASAYTPISISGSITNNSQNVETLSAFSITPNYGALVVSGGSGTINYSWARISGSTAISAGSPSTRNTSFVGTVAPGNNVSATFRLTASDGTSSDTFDVTITVNNTYVTMALSASLPKGTRTVAYSNTLNRTGGKSPFTFAVIAGTLPTGITLNASTGALSGTPTDTTYTDRSLTFRVTDALGATSDASSTLVYRNYPTLSYATAYAMRTRTFTGPTPTAAGGHDPSSYAIQSGSLLTGLSLSGSTGVSSGTPTSTSYGTNVVTVRRTDAEGNTVDASLSTVYADNLTVSGTVSASATAGSAYSSSALSTAGGHGTARSWILFSGSLPPGLTLNASTGAITGTPTTPGGYSFVVRVTDEQGFGANSASQSITVAAALEVSVTPTSRITSFTNDPASSTPSTRSLTSGSFVASATGGAGGYSYAWTRISGTANATINSPSSATTTFTDPDIAVDTGLQTDTFRVTVTDAAMNTATFDVTATFRYDSGF